MNTTIALLDDHQMVLEGIHQTLQSERSFDVLAAFTDPEECVSFIKMNAVDVVIMDMRLKKCHAFDLVPVIQEISNPPKIILISGFYEPLLHKRALSLRVQAFMRKEASHEELINTIKSVKDGNRIVPDTLLQKNDEFLTQTELNVLHFVAKEYTNENIAQALFISRRTVESHVSSICNKLQVQTRIGAVREGIKLNLIK
ncbi:hypothetical protein A5886_001549 [Enterococcus sp. 8G7_MSG3316]|uniref:DNA-binding response regulator n=1 Tax=Candidatus Enterococcus testudinis TaxID=1834191 RepID=A0A242A695_9ENTE|nr:response regulator transcription factor [Enterococcus sp. 8G7_MSG3316]OTN76472.1 hypothetical protein A5886_001549 [Enterococcus sp. 8G7_MSG3316]